MKHYFLFHDDSKSFVSEKNYDIPSGSVLHGQNLHLIQDCGSLIFELENLTKNFLKIPDFFYFEETFRSECRERNERRGVKSVAEVGVPFRGGRSGRRSDP